MTNDEIVVNGGARIGWVNATWPLARLEASRTVLSLKVAFTGTYLFTPTQVHSIEKYSSIPFLGWGIRINHIVRDYPRKIVFWTFGRPETLMKRIADIGFVPQGRPDPSTSDRGIPIRWQAILAIVLLWNALFIADSGFSFDSQRQPGIFSLTAIILLFVGSVLVRINNTLQRLILKPSRDIGEIKSAVNLITLVSGFLSIGLSVQIIVSRFAK
jgi:hypothetical protein